MEDIQKKAANIRLVIFDVDGVLTDGRLYLTEDGKEIKAFHSRDGHGMKMLQKSGVQIAIITGRTSPIVTHRMDELGIKHVYQGQQDKLNAYNEICKKLSLESEQIAYVGDDIVDLPVMEKAGLSIAVKDAHPSVILQSHWQTTVCGGLGAAREVCDLIMESQTLTT